MNVTNAFLNGDLEEEVYMEQPESYTSYDYSNHVCYLQKSLYWLKQSPRSWYAKLNSFLLAQNFIMSEYDHSLYFRLNDNDITIILIYVDDIILCGSNNQDVDDIKIALKLEFEIQDLGRLHYIVGIEVCRSSNASFISQEKYAISILKRFDMDECKFVPTPMESHVRLSIRSDERSFMDITLYRKLIGSLIWLTITRPDLSCGRKTRSINARS